jgi:hypothetical protein
VYGIRKKEMVNDFLRADKLRPQKEVSSVRTLRVSSSCKTSPSRVLSCILLQLSSHFVHTNAGSNKRFTFTSERAH